MEITSPSAGPWPENSPIIHDDAAEIDTAGTLPDDPNFDGSSTPKGDDRSRVNSLRRQMAAMQSQLDAFRPDPEPEPAEVFQALESTMEELRVAVEELRLSNDALRDSQADLEDERRRYRDLFDLAPDAYLVTDLRGIVREANRAATAQLNIEPHFLVGKPLVVFLPEAGRLAFRSEISRLRDEARTLEYDLRLQPRKLPPFDASIRVGVVRDSSGRPVALRWTIRDVSAKRRAEEKVRSLNVQLEHRVVERSEQLESVLQANERWLIKAHAADAGASSEGQLFQEIVDEVDAILWRGDATTGHYTFVSKRAEKLLGYPASRWIEDPNFWLDRIHPEDREWAVAYRRKQLRERGDHEAEYRVVAADGRAIWFREVVRVLQHGPDGPAILYGLMVNISKRKKVERQLYTAKGELASQLRDMTYLHQLGGRLTTARGLQATFDEVLSAVVSLQGADMAMLVLVETGEDRPVLAAGLGLPDEFTRRVGEGSFGAELVPLEPLAIEDVESQPEASFWRDSGRIGGFRALALVPLFNREGKPLGTLATFFKTPYRMADRQARLVEMYAEQAAEAIEAARLLGQIEESDRRKGRLLEAKVGEMKGPLEAILRAALASGDPATIDLIGRQAGLLAGLADELIDASRPDDGTA
jgi:PAS domain S-box-containing protein